MDFLLQPSHLIIILVIVIVLFGPGKLPSLGVSFGRRFRSGLFMAQGVDPEVGRDVGDMLPDEHLSRSTHLHLCFVALVIGNTIYFLLSPLLTPAARFSPGSRTVLPAFVDLWICILVWGILNLLMHMRRKDQKK